MLSDADLAAIRQRARTMLDPFTERHRARSSVGYVEGSYVQYWRAVDLLADALAQVDLIREVQRGSDNGSFYCPACNTTFPTTGNAPATADDLETELQEHMEELHD